MAIPEHTSPPDAARTQTPVLHFDPGDLADAIFLQQALPANMRVIRRERWTASKRNRLPGTPLLDSTDFDGETKAVVDLGEAVASVRIEGLDVHCCVAANDETIALNAMASIRASLPEARPFNQQHVVLTYWWWDHFPRSRRRELHVPTWEEIKLNYTQKAAARLGSLMHRRLAPGDPQLILWHGPPGTGKTFALRALAWEWREWCSVNVVSDPELLFGERPGYLMEVASEGDRDERWRVLVLEDTGELLSADAKERSGQGLSRFLNLVDGLIGEGMRLAVVVTTNEPLRNLHPAVARPGRCLAEIEFAPLSRDEASSWLGERGGEPVDTAHTIAALFAHEAGDEAPPLRKAVGFAA